ncbi:hypothetical protein H6P81_014842 [Aristolochia fimbriata]|uniref:BAH domain-containing protein n=1 Tax=Aristolochia fimbriata TaxID=158543 RepID=A0AAV7E7N2_ARIFI|nr:hypothetical protein H6P81_014842 [Aristolochia fimbriata]
MDTSTSSQSFVEWEEQFISQEKGNRVVHYYFKDSAGDSVLAVVGTERSLRHMVYVVSDDFSRVYGSDKSNNTCFKWRSRREVVNWLTSLLSKKNSLPDSSKSPTNCLSQNSGADITINEPEDHDIYLNNHSGHFARKLKGHDSDIMWSGVAWVCGKQLKHYQAFSRNGTTIPIHSFVLVMAEEENHYLAYLEDMYEDKKGQKKVKVRWFHQSQEVVGRIRIPPPVPHSKEVFITPYAQVISAECVDGLTTILTPEHYEKCLAGLPYLSSIRIHLCFRQFRNNRIKPFNLSKLQGYFNQTILSCLDLYDASNHKSGEEDEDYSPEQNSRKGQKRSRSCRGRQRCGTTYSSVGVLGRGTQITSCGPDYQNLRFGLPGRKPLAVKYIGTSQPVIPPFKVDEKIEILCQDSGIRGCWFRCTVLNLSRKQIKVQYDDLQNEDGCGKLEEWIPAFRAATHDKLGMRCQGRLTIRPSPPNEKQDLEAFKVGTPVDAWWNDGWWEGVISAVENFGDDALQVYYPGEDLFSVVQRKNLRISLDWFQSQWIKIESKPDILSVISAVSPGTKLSTCSVIAKGAESGGSAISTREAHNSERESAVRKRTLLTSCAEDATVRKRQCREGEFLKKCESDEAALQDIDEDEDGANLNEADEANLNEASRL